MSIKIHHGPNGSYKTSGAIQDDAVSAIKEGRLIITNVRGFTLDRVLEAFPDLPDETIATLDVMNLSMESNEDLDKMRKWFMWAPKGAFLIFDETQILFPKSWKEKDLEQFDFPGGIEKAKEADRPTGWLDGWTRHRHWNWDVVLTTPNIRYIRDDIRLTCEKAYLHSNLAVVGIKGRYKEAMHDAQENKPPMDGSTIVEIKKIKPETFKLYESTATGKTQDTKAGKNLFMSPKILGLLGFTALLLFGVFSADPTAIFDPRLVKTAAAPGAASGAGSAAPAGSVASASGPVAGGAVGVRQAGRGPALTHPFEGYTLQVRAALVGLRDGKPHQVVLFDVVDSEGGVFKQTAEELQTLGYTVRVRTTCVVDLQRGRWKQTVFCPGGHSPAPAAKPLDPVPSSPASAVATR
ncbi:hypothetical protein E0E52_14540 [Azotobacter chroococcum]|uniref:zonular occludens toxin domain-containing protein n=1 Tax=Azotobacter chroococcum TaxID=353 RepID=UPI00103972E6|nr:zonular occludens toxin domain-containing protein [Azotobacter chroococcum]TBW03705.1 hypothetical protein E0E52_14540 [Azotobacter chroococcum]